MVVKYSIQVYCIKTYKIKPSCKNDSSVIFACMDPFTPTYCYFESKVNKGETSYII